MEPGSCLQAVMAETLKALPQCLQDLAHPLQTHLR